MEDKQFTYLLEAYKTAVDFFNNYADRVYNRFNILLGIDVLLAGFFSGGLIDAKTNSTVGNFLIVSLGLIISLLLYVQSAQDKFVTKKLRERVNGIRVLIEENIGRDDIPALFVPLDDTDLGKRTFIGENVTSWRSNFISLSKVPVITSVVFVVFWIIAFFVKP